MRYNITHLSAFLVADPSYIDPELGVIRLRISSSKESGSALLRIDLNKAQSEMCRYSTFRGVVEAVFTFQGCVEQRLGNI